MKITRITNYICLSLLFCLTACKANFPVAQESGMEDMAYLLFISDKQYIGKNIVVTLDENPPFEAKVISKKKSYRRGTQYGITTGTKSLKVTYQGRTIYQKKIFLSTQEVKQIILP